MKISLSNEDPAKGLYNHDMSFWSKILDKRQEYKFPTLGNKIWTQDFDEVKLYSDSFFLRWRIVLSVPSTKVFLCDCERQLWLYYASLLSLKNEEIDSSLSFFVFLASCSTPSWKGIWFLLQKRSLRKVRKTAILKFLKKHPKAALLGTWRNHLSSKQNTLKYFIFFFWKNKPMYFSSQRWLFLRKIYVWGWFHAS